MQKKREKSAEIYQASCAVIPGGVNSPVRSFPGLEMTPLIADKGEKDLIWDADGHSYIDYCGSWGALLLGHAHPRIVKATTEQLLKGSTFGIATAVEHLLAAEVIKCNPSVERIRFVSSGTEATMTALRLARGYTKRATIVKFIGNYHGHSDSLLVRAGSGVSYLNPQASSLGVPDDFVRHTVCFQYNDTDAARAFLRAQPVAAVILEPIAANMGVVPATLEFLTMLREETLKNGALLIFDEVISGFRVGLAGAQGLYGITPDLTCFGKIVGGGFPAAAFGGRRDIMEHLAPIGQVYQAGTLSGNPVAMRAGLETLLEIQKPDFYKCLEKATNHLTLDVKEFIRKKDLPVVLNQVGSIFTLFFGVHSVTSQTSLDEDTYKKFFVFLFNRGVYAPPSAYEAWFVSSAHTIEHLEYTRNLILEFLEIHF